jgi:hypothetical protein
VTPAWPSELPGLGKKSVSVFALCTQCGKRWTWSLYGTSAVCLPCAVRLAGPQPQRAQLGAGEVKAKLQAQRERAAQEPVRVPPKKKGRRR